MSMTWWICFMLAVVPRCSDNTAQHEPDTIPAFPGAEGFGKYTIGGRGGKVFIVTNLNDAGAGSLREAVEAKGARTVVFEVSGTIVLASPLKINHGDITIAGQSAPGDGICLRDYNFSISADNVIIRYLRFRLGDVQKQQDDAISCLRHKNIIIDHCSISWATDECASFYDNENFTLQWCIISESLNHSIHKKGDHGYGGIWGGMGATFHHNLLTHHISRLPRFCGSRYHNMSDREVVDFRNNVIYNWRSNNSYGGERGNHNMVNNYYKSGPSTASHKDRVVNPSQPYGKFYVTGNYVKGFNAVTSDNWNGGVQCNDLDSVKASQPFPAPSIPEQSAEEAFQSVLRNAGASLPRDAIDTRLVEEVRSGTATYGKNKKGIIDSQEEVGAWPVLQQEEPAQDSDRDGMPDVWEVSHGLNEEEAGDAGQYSLDKKYTNLEVYLNGLIP